MCLEDMMESDSLMKHGDWISTLGSGRNCQELPILHPFVHASALICWMKKRDRFSWSEVFSSETSVHTRVILLFQGMVQKRTSITKMMTIPPSTKMSFTDTRIS